MIIEFSVGNFRSFKEMETFSMVAAPIRSKDKELDVSNVTVINDKLTLLRSKAIYGANASGKSNIMKAFSLFKRLIRSSVADEGMIKRAYDDFVLDGQFGQKPIFYQLLFIYENTTYRYGIEVMQSSVSTEWLYNNKEGGREVKLFTREGNKVSVNQAQFSEAKKFENLADSGDSDIFQSHSLFLSATAAVGVKLSKVLQQMINSINVINPIETAVLKTYGIDWWLVGRNRYKGTELLKAADVGIVDIGFMEEEPLVEGPQNESQKFIDKETRKITQLTSLRKIFIGGSTEPTWLEAIFESFESEGTKGFAYLIPAILDVLETGSTLWVDEFDARLHPLLTKKIISLFHSTNTNPHGAQLIFATHDTNLLKPSFLRRDQICFVEKDQYGVSHLKTLVEFKGVRNDASYDKDYLQGRYGAVPFLNELDEAVEKSIAPND